MDIITQVNFLFSNSINSQNNQLFLTAKWIETIYDSMIVISDDKALYLLEFVQRKNLIQEIQNLILKTKAHIILGNSQPIVSITQELNNYFAGTLKEFLNPYYLLGTVFQNAVWQSLTKIPYGQTKSYLQQAQSLNKATAVRAIASANGRNQLAMIVPCHRVINTSGKLGGYSGGIDNKIWLLKHEAKFV